MLLPLCFVHFWMGVFVFFLLYHIQVRTRAAILHAGEAQVRPAGTDGVARPTAEADILLRDDVYRLTLVVWLPPLPKPVDPFDPQLPWLVLPHVELTIVPVPSAATAAAHPVAKPKKYVLRLTRAEVGLATQAERGLPLFDAGRPAELMTWLTPSLDLMVGDRGTLELVVLGELD